MLVIRADVLCTHRQMAKEEVRTVAPLNQAMHLTRVIQGAPASPCQRDSHPRTKQTKAPHPTRLDHNLSNPNGSCFTANIGPCGKPHVNRMPCTGPTPHTTDSRPYQTKIRPTVSMETQTVVLWQSIPYSRRLLFGHPVLVLLASPISRGCLDIAAIGGQQQKNLHNLPVCLATNALSYSAPSPAVSGMPNS